MAVTYNSQKGIYEDSSGATYSTHDEAAQSANPVGTPERNAIDANLASTGITSPTPITPESATEDVSPITLPDPVETGDTAVASYADSSLEAILAAYNAQPNEVGTGNELRTNITDLMKGLGEESARRDELESEIDPQKEELQGVMNTLTGLRNEKALIPIELQQESVGRGRTAGGIAPIEQGRLRQNTIQTLRYAAQAQALQGDLKLAQESIDRAIKAEFDPMRTQLDIYQQLYNFNKDDLERADKKKADMMSLALSERTRVIDKAEANKKSVYDIGLMARKYGADTATVEAIFNSANPEEAVKNAGTFLNDPVAEQELANAKLSNQLTQLRIDREAEEFRLWQAYGGMTKAEYIANQKKEQEAIDATTDEATKATLQGQAIGIKITLLDSMLKSSGLNSIVGTNLLSRGKTTTVGGATLAGAGAGFVAGGPVGAVVGGAVGLGGSLILGGNLDQMTGAGQDAINMTEQFISKEFLQSLIDVKAQGATFGALQKAEQDALTAAATKIGNARIREGDTETGKVIGYNMSEKDYKAEVETLQQYARLAYERSMGKAFLPDEDAVFNAMDEANQPITNPAF